jgi:hypothetical protein
MMVAYPFILPGHLLLGVVGFCDMTALQPRHERVETPLQRRPLYSYFCPGLLAPLVFRAIFCLVGK